MATYLSFWGLLIAGLGAAGVHWQITSPVFGIYTVVAGLGLLCVSFFLGLFYLLRYGRSETPFVGLILGALGLGALGYAGARTIGSPVSDLSTDPKNPPAFLGPLYTVVAPGPDGTPDPAFRWPRDYESDPAARGRFPKLTPLLVQGAPEKLYPAAAQALKNLPPPWKLSFEDPAKFHLELERTNPVSRFVDDVVIEIRPLAAREGSASRSSTIELRSRARWAPRLPEFSTDFGTGYRRIVYLKGLLELATKAAEQAEINARKTPVPVSPPPTGASPAPVASKPTAPALVPAPTPILAPTPKPVAAPQPVPLPGAKK